MRRTEYNPGDAESAVHRFLDMLENTRPSADVMAAIAIERLLVNPTFRFQVTSLETADDPNDLLTVQEYLAEVADEHALSPEHMSEAMQRVMATLND